jgi:hypothetical protein
VREKSACEAGKSPTLASLGWDLHDPHCLQYAVLDAAEDHNWETVAPV